MTFPTTRLRRLRYNANVRRLVQTTTVTPDKLIMPLFVSARLTGSTKIPIASMPGQFQLSIDALVKECEELAALGIGGVMLFGIPAHKDAIGSDALSDGIISKALQAVKQSVGDKLLMITDVCFCEYTIHGHCGVLCNGDVDNDCTLKNLVRQTLIHCRNGADMIAPSGMLDGAIQAIRRGMDEAGFERIPIMSYAAKYASAFYGPFRDAAESAPVSGNGVPSNRKTYQMDYAASPEQAIREVGLDLEEGADIVMVKPALAYLDIIRIVKDRFKGVPVAAYNVSGEYSMVKSAAEKGWLDEQAVVLESLSAIFRAGADIIMTYWAKDVARWCHPSSTIVP